MIRYISDHMTIYYQGLQRTFTGPLFTWIYSMKSSNIQHWVRSKNYNSWCLYLYD